MEKIPSFKITNPEIIEINPTTSFITSLKTGETDIQILDYNHNNEIINTLKVYVVDKKVPIEDFLVDNLEIKKITQI